jgi:hypothetical protein
MHSMWRTPEPLSELLASAESGLPAQGVCPPESAIVVPLQQTFSDGVEANDSLFFTQPYQAVQAVHSSGTGTGANHMHCAPSAIGGYTVGFAEAPTPAGEAVGRVWSFPRPELQAASTPPYLRRRYVGLGLRGAPTTVLGISNPERLTVEVMDLGSGAPPSRRSQTVHRQAISWYRACVVQRAGGCVVRQVPGDRAWLQGWWRPAGERREAGGEPIGQDRRSTNTCTGWRRWRTVVWPCCSRRG